MVIDGTILGIAKPVLESRLDIAKIPFSTSSLANMII